MSPAVTRRTGRFLAEDIEVPMCERCLSTWLCSVVRVAHHSVAVGCCSRALPCTAAGQKSAACKDVHDIHFIYYFHVFILIFFISQIVIINILFIFWYFEYIIYLLKKAPSLAHLALGEFHKHKLLGFGIIESHDSFQNSCFVQETHFGSQNCRENGLLVGNCKGRS